LADWPDAGPTGDLLAIARTSSSQVHKVLALRGAIRMAGLPDGRPAGDKVKPLAEVMAMASRPEEKKAALAALSSIAHPAALELALAGAADASLELEAATAVVKIAKSLQKTNLDAAGSAVRKLLEVCRLPEARQLAESSLIVVDRMVNVAPRGTASSPDELDKDGASSGDQAAIDGDTNTYWDEKDGQPLYRLVVTFPQAERIAALSIVGYQHHGFAPRDFEILGDGKLLKKVENAQYEDNFLVVKLDEVTVKEVELKITGYYGGSPAIRELGLYRPAE
jgi:hypothetical protein